MSMCFQPKDMQSSDDPGTESNRHFSKDNKLKLSLQINSQAKPETNCTENNSAKSSANANSSAKLPKISLTTAELVAYISLYLWQPDRFEAVLLDSKPKISRLRSSSADAPVLENKSEGSPVQQHIVKVSHSLPDFVKFRNYVRYLFEYAGITDLIAYSGLHYTYLLKQRMSGNKGQVSYAALPSNTFDLIFQKIQRQIMTPQSAHVHTKAATGHQSVERGSEYRLLITSTLLAHKVLQDETYTCKHWARICNNRYIPSYYPAEFESSAAGERVKQERHNNAVFIESTEVTRMEREFLLGLHHSMNLNRAMTLQWINWIMQFRELLTNIMFKIWVKRGFFVRQESGSAETPLTAARALAIPSPVLSVTKAVTPQSAVPESAIAPQIPTPVMFYNMSIKGKKHELKSMTSRRISLAFLAQTLQASTNLTSHGRTSQM